MHQKMQRAEDCVDVWTRAQAVLPSGRAGPCDAQRCPEVCRGARSPRSAGCLPADARCTAVPHMAQCAYGSICRDTCAHAPPRAECRGLSVSL